MSRSTHLLALLWLAASGCARESAVKAPDPSSAGWVTPPGYDWPPRVVGRTDRLNPGERALHLSKLDPITTSRRGPLPSDSSVPGGETCLRSLEQQGVRFESLPEERGVDTPILLRGPLGGVTFYSSNGPMVVDCRMALALTQVGPIFTELGVRRARFSGAYVYRTSKKGRLSLHAYGLAIDLHAVNTEDDEYAVSKSFARGLGDSCSIEAPLLNQLACRLKARGLFRELLTPDYDADHHDHLHLGLAPLPTAGAGTSIAAKTPARSGTPTRPQALGKTTNGVRRVAAKPAMNAADRSVVAALPAQPPLEREPAEPANALPPLDAMDETELARELEALRPSNAPPLPSGSAEPPLMLKESSIPGALPEATLPEATPPEAQPAPRKPRAERPVPAKQAVPPKHRKSARFAPKDSAESRAPSKRQRSQRDH